MDLLSDIPVSRSRPGAEGAKKVPSWLPQLRPLLLLLLRLLLPLRRP